MGKRKPRSGLTGLSQFVLDAFNQDSKPELPEEAPAISEHSPPIDAVSNEPPIKRRKTDGDGTRRPDGNKRWVKGYEATGLVLHYTDAAQVPEHLQKYFSQRFRYFSQYSTPPGCLLDEEGWYSVTPELIADQIAERCRCDTILDAFCGVGGNAIAFAKTCERVIALDTSPTRLALARHNAQIYGVADRIEFVLADYISFANSYLQRPRAARGIDVIFLSPPWGGPSYLSGTSSPTNCEVNTSGLGISGDHDSSYSLASIRPVHGDKLFRLSREITQNIAYYLPRNARLEEISQLLNSECEDAGKSKGKRGDLEMVEVEEEWMGSKLKALTCYFGGLAAGQEGQFDE